MYTYVYVCMLKYGRTDTRYPNANLHAQFHAASNPGNDFTWINSGLTRYYTRSE